MFNHDLPKDDYDVEESTLEEEDKSENVEYNHMRTPNYTIVLSSSYEDNITGENQYQFSSKSCSCVTNIHIISKEDMSYI